MKDDCWEGDGEKIRKMEFIGVREKVFIWVPHHITEVLKTPVLHKLIFKTQVQKVITLRLYNFFTHYKKAGFAV